MKLLTSIYEIEDIKNLMNSIDYALINVPHYSINYKDIDIDLAIDLLNKNNKGIVLSINKIMHPNDIKNIDEFIYKYKDYNLLFYIADFGLINIFMKYNIVSKAIYNPETMITNYLDLNEYYT